MGRIDRKPRGNARWVRGCRPSTQDSALSGNSAKPTVDWLCSAALSKFQAQFEESPRSHSSSEDACVVSLNRLAELPSPLRRSRGVTNEESASPISSIGTPPSVRSYRDQLRAKGELVLHLSQEAELVPRSLPPFLSAPKSDEVIASKTIPNIAPPMASAPFFMDTTPSYPLVCADGKIVATFASLDSVPVVHPRLPVATPPKIAPTCMNQSFQVVMSTPLCTAPSHMTSDFVDGITPTTMSQPAFGQLVEQLHAAAVTGMIPASMSQLDFELLAKLVRAAEPDHYED